MYTVGESLWVLGGRETSDTEANFGRCSDTWLASMISTTVHMNATVAYRFYSDIRLQVTAVVRCGTGKGSRSLDP